MIYIHTMTWIKYFKFLCDTLEVCNYMKAPQNVVEAKAPDVLDFKVPYAVDVKPPNFVGIKAPNIASCLCAYRETVPVTSTPCGTVIKEHTYGACWQSTGFKNKCGGSEWYQIEYGVGKNAWVNSSDVQKDVGGNKCSGSGGNCDNVEFVSRAEWGARKAKTTSPMSPPMSMVFIHHTAGVRCFTKEDCISTIKGVQNFHMDDRKWDDIGYSFIVGEDGRVYEGRGWLNVPAQSRGWNTVAYGVCVMGNFAKEVPAKKAQQAMKDIIDCGIRKGYVTLGHEEFGHRDGRCTDCPGDAFYKQLKTWPRYSSRDIPIHC